MDQNLHSNQLRKSHASRFLLRPYIIISAVSDTQFAGLKAVTYGLTKLFRQNLNNIMLGVPSHRVKQWIGCNISPELSTRLGISQVHFSKLFVEVGTRYIAYTQFTQITAVAKN